MKAHNMTTKKQYADQCRADNPEMIVTENDKTRKLTKAEYDEAISAWSQMKVEQEKSGITNE
jgi:hypothetical protein